MCIPRVSMIHSLLSKASLIFVSFGGSIDLEGGRGRFFSWPSPSEGRRTKREDDD